MIQLGWTGIDGNVYARATTRDGEDDVAEKGHGRALVSKFHGEPALRRGVDHGGGYRISQRTLT